MQKWHKNVIFLLLTLSILFLFSRIIDLSICTKFDIFFFNKNIKKIILILEKSTSFVLFRENL